MWPSPVRQSSSGSSVRYLSKVNILYGQRLLNFSGSFNNHIFPVLFFDWISEERAIISLYTNKWLVLQQTKRDRTAENLCLYISQCSLSSEEAVPWLRRSVFNVWHRSDRFDYSQTICEFWWTRWNLEWFFFKYFCFDTVRSVFV